MPNRRENEFPQKIKNAAALRQDFKCAFCGKPLILEPNQAHHVISARLGKHVNVNDLFIMSLDNCVVLHDKCHLEDAHSGNFVHGPVLDAIAFKHSHGNNKVAHDIWVLKHDKIWQARLLPRR